MEGCSLLAVLARRVNNFTAVTWKGFVYRFKHFIINIRPTLQLATNNYGVCLLTRMSTEMNACFL
jgi:hypothetical protein